jgi:uncharacterized protein (TIGR02001 family)
MFRAFAFAVFAFAAAPALAQESPASGFALSGETLIITDYRFRGISRSDEAPAAQLSLILNHDRGFYAGARGTTLKGTDPFRARDPAFGDLGDIQLDLSAGWRADLGGGFDLDAGLTYYAFAGGRGAADYAEPHASIGYLIGPAQLSTGIRYAPAQDGTGGEDMVWLFGQVEVSVPFRPWRFTAQAGRQDWGAFGRYWTWSLGARHQLRALGLPAAELGLSYVDTDLPATRGQDAGLIASLSLRF